MFKQAWGIIKRNPAPILGVALAYSVLEFALTKMLTPYFSNMSLDSLLGPNLFNIMFGIVGLEVIKLLFLTGFLPMVLVALDGGEISVSSFKLFITKKRLLSIVLLECVIVPIMFAGVILLVVPGIVWVVMTIMSYFIVVGNDDIGTMDAISKSMDITIGFRWKIFGYVVLYGLLSTILSMVPMMVVVFDTVLMSFFYVILALIYRECMTKNVG